VAHWRRPEVELFEAAEMNEGSEGGLGRSESTQDEALQVQRAEAPESVGIGPGMHGPELDLGTGRDPHETPGLDELPPPAAPSVACPGPGPPATVATHGQHPEGVLRGEVELPGWEGQGPERPARPGHIDGLPSGAAVR